MSLLNITPAEEKQFWAPLQTAATDAFAFWKTFLGLSDGSGAALGAVDAAKWLRMIRAVSLVESRHGTGSGNQPKRDPMQCGNPADVWWRELTGQTAQFDILQRGLGLSPASISADKLAAKAAAESSFPPAAKLSSLAKPKDGHKDSAFTPVMSLYWAVPLLAHKTNTKAGVKTFNCGDSSEARLVAGAIAYNGGGDPKYGDKIKEALTIIDTPAVPAAAQTAQAVEIFEKADTAATFSSFVQTLRDTAAESRGVFFPHGITDIEFSIEVAGVKVSLKVSGPAA